MKMTTISSRTRRSNWELSRLWVEQCAFRKFVVASSRLTSVLMFGLIRTESYDDFGPVGEDPRWDTFADLHTTLEEVFPRVSV